MKAEYFPPKEDVILENETPTDLYVLVSGAMELIVLKNGTEQVIKNVYSGDVCGEIGVLCYKPQLCTVRTKRYCQLLRLNRTVFLNLVQANVGDGAIIVNNLLEHLKEQNDPVMQEALRETESLLARGRMDMPLGLWFAAARGDEPLLQHLLRQGSDPNEADMNGRTALHLAAANGSENCAGVLLAYGADPNIKDSEGNVPLWDAIKGRHESLIKLLIDNGATLASGDVPMYASNAAEQGNLELLKDIVHYGGDVTSSRSNGSTALHAAVSSENATIVKFLLKQGADVDKSDLNGCTPRGLAETIPNEEIKALFFSDEEASRQSVVTVLDKEAGPTFIKTTRSSSSIDVTPRIREVTWADRQPRRPVNTYRNSLFGIMSAAARADTTADGSGFSNSPIFGNQPARVILRCPGKGEVAKLVMLPDTIQELLEVGSKKFGCHCTKLVTSDGAEVDEIELVRDGDQLCLIYNDESITPES